MGGFLGGGFFGSGASETNSDSRASQTSQNAEGGSSPISLSNLSAGKNGSVNVNMTTNVTSSDYGAISEAFNFASNALSDTAAFAYDGISLAADVMNNSANLAYDGLNMSAGLVGDSLVMNGQMALSVLNSSEVFADRAALLSLENSKMNAQLSSYAMDSVNRSADQSRYFAYDAMNQVSSAYNFANQGLLALSYDNADRLAFIQNESLKVINENAAQSQLATERAMDYVFESTKTAEERLIADSTKWLVGAGVAIVAVMAFPSVARVFK